MNSKLACALAFTALLLLGTASAQTGGRNTVAPGGPLIEAPTRTRALTNAELSTRVIQLEAQVAQLASRIETLNGQLAALEGYPTHRHGFNDNLSVGESAHDITGAPQP